MKRSLLFLSFVFVCFFSFSQTRIQLGSVGGYNVVDEFTEGRVFIGIEKKLGVASSYSIAAFGTGYWKNFEYALPPVPNGENRTGYLDMRNGGAGLTFGYNIYLKPWLKFKADFSVARHFMYREEYKEHQDFVFGTGEDQVRYNDVRTERIVDEGSFSQWKTNLGAYLIFSLKYIELGGGMLIYPSNPLKSYSINQAGDNLITDFDEMELPVSFVAHVNFNLFKIRSKQP